VAIEKLYRSTFTTYCTTRHLSRIALKNKVQVEDEVKLRSGTQLNLNLDLNLMVAGES
jgi:hypothetical protein